MVSNDRVGYLEELEHELDSRGLVARVVRTRSGPVFLRVVNPEAASLAEDITCAPTPDGPDHYYWWSWGERMHRVDDPGGAAVKLAHVLGGAKSHVPMTARAVTPPSQTSRTAQSPQPTALTARPPVQARTSGDGARRRG